MKKWQIYYYEDDELTDCSDDFASYKIALEEAKSVIEDCTETRAEIVEITTVACVDREYKIKVSKP